MNRLEELKRSRHLMLPRRVHPVMRYPDSAAMAKRIRERTGLTQRQFAEKAEINFRTYQGIEAGRFRPSDENMVKLKRMR